MMKRRISHYFIAGVAVTIVLSLAEGAHAGTFAASLREQVERFVAERTEGSFESISVPPLGDFELEGIDPRDIQVQLSTRARGRLVGAIAVNVVLSNDERVLKRGVVTAQVQTNDQVWVAARELPRGTQIARSDLRLESLDTRSVPSGAISDVEELVGLQLRRSLKAGAVLRTRYMEAVSLVTRGQIVRIVLQGAGFKIVGKGRAVTDGAIGQHIRVVNTDSRREVTGRVARNGSIYVDM